MIFNSVTYLVFLSIAIALYWSLPRRPRLLMLFIASVVFYGFWSFTYVPLMIASVVADYTAARFIAKSIGKKSRQAALVGAIVLNLSLLVFFKYYYFAAENLVGIGSFLGIDLQLPQLAILLPIGISFYTFQSMSYTIDVYRGFIKPTKDFLLFSNYVMFFPQLIAGPILRAKEIIWQLDVRPSFDPQNLANGLKRIAAGLFLKVVFADNLGNFVDDVYGYDPAILAPIDTLTMGFLFGLQIYFDFAAYSHIAIGSALLMGIKFPENFNFPYSAASPRDFWKRWHISLSSWIRDYLYLPLTGAKLQDRSVGGLETKVDDHVGKSSSALALFITWAIMGLWHGAGWAFVLWGVCHALLIQLYRTVTKFPIPANRLTQLLGWAITLTLTMLAWVPFRTQSLEDTLVLWGHLVSLDRWTTLNFKENVYLFTAIVMLLTLAAPFIERKLNDLAKQSTKLAYSIDSVGFCVMIALTFIYLQSRDQFIYFQF